MISVKYAAIIAVAAFAAGSFFASPVPKAIAAVIATDVQCTGCVGTSDLANNAVTAIKIKDGEVKAAEIATDAVGAAELAGVTKLLFASCNPAGVVGNSATPNAALNVECIIAGVDSSDHVVATLKGGHNFCYFPQNVVPSSGKVTVDLSGICQSAPAFQAGDRISIIVYDK
ncbi:MAG TPA: hypothetical protein VGQ03_08965 [Nitrososphaera sp.]|jgi:hypothetical protein|nr:hypothetical protein [Nitrososphaera sp.]